jgi:hypothetical protein
MSPTVRRALVPGLVLLAVAVWFAWPRGSSSPGGTAGPADGGSASGRGPSGAAGHTSAGTYKPGSRTRVPKVVRNVASTAVTPTPSQPSAPAPEPAAPAVTDGPIDRRENPPADSAETARAIKAKMDDVSDDIAECLDGWMTVDPSLQGKVNVAFRIDADGLQDAWIMDHTDVPFGPLTCFGTAIYDVDWAGVSKEPLEVTFPFTFDAGAPADGSPREGTTPG